MRWLKEGHRATGKVVFDVGGATRAALIRIANGVPALSAGGASESDNGNGSLMRILPVALRWTKAEPAELAARAMEWSSITHRHPRSQLACACYCLLVQQLLNGLEPTAAWTTAAGQFRHVLTEHPAEAMRFKRLLEGDPATLPRDEIQSGGYVIDTLEAAVWCLLQGGSFADIVLRAVNLGGDTDTTACVAGGLAGVVHGRAAISQTWRDRLRDREKLTLLVERFVASMA